MLGSLFGSSAKINARSKVEELTNNLTECINQRTQIEGKYKVETEELNKSISELRAECDTRKLQVEVLTKKLGRRQHRVIELKRVIEEMANKISSLNQHIAVVELDKENLAARLAKLQPPERPKHQPMQGINLMKKRTEGLFFEETGSLEEDICKLKCLLIERTRELRSAGTRRETAKGARRAASSGRFEAARFGCREKVVKQQMCEANELIASVDCPFRAKAKEIQELVEKHEAKIMKLEKKEQILNKIVNTSVF